MTLLGQDLSLGLESQQKSLELGSPDPEEPELLMSQATSLVVVIVK